MGFLTTPVEDELIAESKRKRQEEELKRQKEREAMDMLATFRSGDTPKNAALDKGIAEQLANARYAQSNLPLPPIQSQDPEAEAMQQAGMGREQVPRATGIATTPEMNARIMSPDYQKLPSAPAGFEAGGKYSGTQAAEQFREKKLVDELGPVFDNLPEEDRINSYVQLAQIFVKNGYIKEGSEFAKLGMKKIDNSPAAWEEKTRRINAINGMEDGPEKEQAKEEFMQTFASSTWAGMQPSVIQAAKDRAVGVQEATLPGKIKEQYSLIPGKEAEAAAVTTARNTAELKTPARLSTTEAKGLGDFSASFGQLSELTNSVKGGAPFGPFKQARAANPYDYDAQMIRQLIVTTKQTVGKALEGGVLRAEDEVKYAKILPKSGDTPKVALGKAEQIKTMLDIAYKAQLESMRNANYDVSGYKPSLISSVDTTAKDLLEKIRTRRTQIQGAQ